MHFMVLYQTHWYTLRAVSLNFILF